MAFEEFTGQLDAPAGGGGFAPFSGELDAPVAAKPAGRATDAEIDSLLKTPINSDVVNEAAPAKPGAVGEELANLRDSFFTGVDSSRASLKTVNVAAQASALQAKRDNLVQLETAGKGQSPEAEGVRKYIQAYEKRLPTMISGMTEAQADAKRGAEMTTRPAVAALNKVKTFSEAWDIFKENPYDVIAGVTSQSLANTIPALITGAVLGPVAGASMMGISSAATEAGSSLGEFAGERGVDMTNPKAVEAFFTDRQNLAEAMAYAGKRAGIIGTLDAASGGMAGKTLAPALKSKIARQAVNLPTQMGVQAGLGAGGEAGAQLATKGKIDQPGQVLMEAAGELGGAPMEVAAFGREARLAAREKAFADKYPTEPGTLPGVPPAPVDPVAEIAKAQNVDEAIAAAQAAVQSSTAVDNIGEILKQNLPAALSTPAPAATENVAGLSPDVAQTTQAITELEAANVSPRPDLQPVLSGADRVGLPEPRIGMESGVGVGAVAGPTVEPGGVRAEPAGDFVPLEPGAQLDAVDPRLIPVSQRVANVQNQTPAGPAAQSQAAPAEAPKAGAAAGSPAASAGTAPGTGGVEAAGVVDRAALLPDNASYANPAQRPAVSEQTTLGRVSQPDTGSPGIAASNQPEIARPDRQPTAPGQLSTPSARQVAIQAEKARIEAKRVERAATMAQASAAPAGLSVGMMPNTAEPVTVKNGVVYIGKYPASNFDTGADVTVDVNATLEQIRDALVQSGALGKKARVFGVPNKAPAIDGRALPATNFIATETPNAAQQRADFAASEKARKVPGNAARTRANAENPFKAFLGKHGISNSLAAEFAPGRKERQAAMVQGYGPMFRKSGPQLDDLAARAVEEGFLLTPDEAKLQALIADVLRGKRVIPQYAQGVAENEGTARAARAADLEQQDAEAQNAEVEAENKAERAAIQAVAELPDAGLEFLAGSDVVLTASNNVSEADFLRALGATEQEIEDATAKQSEGARQGDQGRAGAEENAAGAAPGNSQGRDGQAGDTEGLTSPTPADVLAQQQRATEGDKAAAKATTAAADRARADAELPEFTLTGSDRPADVAAAGGQGSMFAPAPEYGYTDANGQVNDSTQPDDGREPAAAGTAADDGLRGAGGSVQRRARITGLGIAADIQRAGSAALVGREIKSADELAELAQIYRDPRYETFRVFFTKGDTVVHATGVSARLPGQAPMIPAGMTNAEYFSVFRDDMARTGADGYYILHNHPSGNPTPSDSDRALTMTIANTVPGFKAHVVINSNKYAVIEPRAAGGMDEKVQVKDFGEDKLLQASKPVAAIGRSITNSDDLAMVGKSMQKPGWITLIGLGSDGKVRMVAEAPSQALTRSPEYLAGTVRRLQRQSGSASMFAVGDSADINSAPVKQAVREGILRDALPETGRPLSESMGSKSNSPFDKTKGRNVAEEDAAYTPAERATNILDAADIKGKDRLEALRDVRAGLITPDELEAAYPAKAPVAEQPAQFSRAAPGEERNALEAISQNDELFALPKSEATTVEEITADNDPAITVKKANDTAGRTTYTFTMPDGKTATMSVRPFNPYATPDAPTLYGYEMVDGFPTAFVTERPGSNPEDVGPVDDVWIDVSRLKQGGQGAKIYNIAATYAHNTGKVFIGDPAGLSDDALRRRTEHMLSSALKFGTTQHIAPHPRQVSGDRSLGIPPLEWTYGDDLGNIRSLIDTTLKSFDGALTNPFNYDIRTGTFIDSNGDSIDREGMETISRADGQMGRKANAGDRTLARNAVLRAIRDDATASRPTDSGTDSAGRADDGNSIRPAGDGRRNLPGNSGPAANEGNAGRNALVRQEGGSSSSRGQGNGILGRLVGIASQSGAPARGIFYSEGGQPAVRNPSTVESVQAAVAELIGGKQLPNKLGRVVATTASEIKSYWEPQLKQNVQLGSEGEAGQAQAFYDPRTKTVFLIADNIPAGDETAVFAHELMHAHGQTVLGKDGWDKLHTVINSWANSPEDSDERAVYNYARSRVEAVGMELSSQEMFPYAVEAAIKMGVKPSLIAKQGTVARWLGSVKYAMQQAWGKVTGKPETFKTQDLVDLAFGIAQMENPESAAAMGRITDALVSPDTAEVDEGLVVTPGKGLIKGKFLSSADGNGTPGGPWNTEAEALDAAKAWRAKLEQKAADALMDRARKNDFAQRLRAGHVPTPQEVEGLGLRAAGSELKYFVPLAAELFGINSRQVRPLIADLIRTGTTDMGAKRESVNPMKALAQMALSQDDIRYSRTATQTGTPASQPNLSPWRDETGRLQFAPGAWLYDRIGKAASPLLVKLSMKAATPELRRQLRQMKIDVEKAQEVSVAIARETSKMTEDERAMVSDLVEQELKVGVIPPAHAVKLAAMINDAMGRQTDELVSLGMLTKDSADKWRGKYLPRYYESKLKDKIAKAGSTWASALMGLTGRQSVMKGIKGKNLKGRGLYETIPEAELANYEALGWEVRDPDYTPSLPTVDGTVQVWRDFSPAEREKMGEIRDAGFRFVMGYMQTQRDIALGRMFERMAQDPESSSRLEKEGYVQVPTSVVSGTGAKVYGKLAGRWVPRETMSQLSNIEESTSAAWQMYRKAMGVWKQGKTSMNPVSHVNNMVSNLTMAHLAGVSYLRGDKYLAAARDFVKKTPMLMEAKDNGLFLGTISDTELMNSMPEELRILAQKQESTTLKVARTGFDVMTMFLRKPMGAAYQAEDTFFRYLIYKDARERGTEPQDAVDYAQRYIFTYDDLPKGARMIRDFGIPFFSYTYKAAPALLHTALTHPLRMAAPAAVLWGINAAAYAIATGDDDDDWQDSLQKYLTDPEFRAKAREREKLERELLPPWNKGTTALLTPKMIRLGMDEVTKLPLFIDVSRIIPGGDLFDVSPNAGGIPLPQPITPSHPLFTTAVAMLGNKDLFRGKDLVDKNDTRGEATEKRLEWLWTQLSPAVAAGNYHWERGMNALAQANGGEVKWIPDVLGGDATGIGKDGLPVQPKYAAMQTFGIKVRPMDLDTSAAIDKNMQNKLLRDIDAEMSALRRLESKGAVSPRTVDKARELADMKKDRIKQGLTVDGSERD